MLLGSGSGVGRTAEVWKFNAASCKWSNLVCKGENIPTSRDGHTVTYIGNGKVVLFGGQGYPYTNEKSEKITEIQKVKTYFVREVYNNLYEFDCETLTWKALLIEGASLPMGRRGHIAFYVPSHGGTIAHRHSRSHSSHRVKHGNGPEEENCLPGHSLIVFGGAGVEPSKYTEILYNDLWAYSFARTRWTRVATKGIEPRPMFDHKAEMLGDNLIVVGGITGVTAQQRHDMNMITSDVMMLNTKTLTWQYLDIYDSRGRATNLRLHGHSLVAERPGGALLLFGGRETVEAKRAAIEIAPAKGVKVKAPPVCWRLEISDQVRATPFMVKGPHFEMRYGHVGVAATGNVVISL